MGGTLFVGVVYYDICIIQVFSPFYIVQFLCLIKLCTAAMSRDQSKVYKMVSQFGNGFRAFLAVCVLPQCVI